MWFPDRSSSKLYIDMTFSLDLNFSSFDYKNFQNLSITNNDLASFDVTY